MYRKSSETWLKHWDFIVIDLVTLLISFGLAFLLRGDDGWGEQGDMYRNMAVFLTLADAVVIALYGTMKDVLKRGHWRNFVVTLGHTLVLGGAAMAYLFMIKMGSDYSRLQLAYTFCLYFALSYITRELWKQVLVKRMKNKGADQTLLVITTAKDAANLIDTIQDDIFVQLRLAGLVLLDEDRTGETIDGVPVVASAEDAPMYVCQHWIDEVLVVPSEEGPYPVELMEKLGETGVTTHLNLAKVSHTPGKKQLVEKMGPYTVLTTAMNCASTGQLVLKRIMDICGGLVGCLLTGIITIFVGPAIYMASPGPIFFSQTRVGRNGRTFKMYKFRSMYMDAEARKAELMKQNKIADGKMFKLDFDPRVIGNKILPDGTKRTGVGDFIRRTSLDEFPQFFNVLKGDMSVVGTRPPLPSETSLYELRHRTRLAIKPGVTGMWQVSGRSDITDFEEVVRLDKEYIENWNVGLDIKILLKTIMVVLKKDGSM